MTGILVNIGSGNGLLPVRRKVITRKHRNHILDSKLFIQSNEFENIVCKMVAILSRPQCFKFQLSSHHIIMLIFVLQQKSYYGRDISTSTTISIFSNEVIHDSRCDLVTPYGSLRVVDLIQLRCHIWPVFVSKGVTVGMPGPHFNIKTAFPGIGIPMIKIRRS